jgi:hypothetical protein
MWIMVWIVMTSHGLEFLKIPGYPSLDACLEAARPVNGKCFPINPPKETKR